MGLNATVTPGLTVTSSTVLSAANLNLLGTPTISITGSIDSSDIGANTVDTIQIKDDAVSAAKVGAIGGNNFIIKGDSNTSSSGISSSALDGSNDPQISLLVNDTSTLKARYVTGSLNVTAATDTNTLDLIIKDDTVTSGMLKTDAVQAHIGNLQPGGGLSANGGLANVNQNEGGGIIFFDNNEDATIGSTSYYGKAKVLPIPKAANQVLKSTQSGAISFGVIGGQADSYVSAYIDQYLGDTSTTVRAFEVIHQYNVISLKTTAMGQARVYFPNTQYANGDTVTVMGYGLTDSDPDSHMQMAASLTTVATEEVDGVSYKYIDIVFVHAKEFNGHPNSNSSYRRKPNYVHLHFYS